MAGFDSVACFNDYSGEEVNDSTPTPQEIIDGPPPRIDGEWVWISYSLLTRARNVVSLLGRYPYATEALNVVRDLVDAITESERDARFLARVSAISTPSTARSHYDDDIYADPDLVTRTDAWRAEHEWGL